MTQYTMQASILKSLIPLLALDRDSVVHISWWASQSHVALVSITYYIWKAKKYNHKLMINAQVRLVGEVCTTISHWQALSEHSRDE